jgi:hypothetical protein
MGEARPIEWPPGSGIVASYEPHEERFLAEIARTCERGEIDESQAGAEVGLIHALKAELGARILPDEPAEDYEPYEFPSPDSPFQMPPRAAEILASRQAELPLE